MGARGGRSLALVGSLAVTLAIAKPAHAGDPDALAAAGAIAGIIALVTTDVSFTVYTGGVVARLDEPDTGWMIGQATVTGAETAVASGFVAGLAGTDKVDPGLEVVPMPFAIWMGAMSTYSAWSLAQPGAVRSDLRFALSWVISTNMVFTCSAISELVDDGYAPLYLAVPEATLMASEAALTGYKAVTDEANRPQWIALSAWSGVLTVHAVVSLFGSGLRAERSQQKGAPPTAAPPPPTPTPDPYYQDPVQPLPPEQARPAAIVIPPPVVVPSSGSEAPGMSVVGIF
ncbi:MAG: hypothetical protein U0271_21305 [Polyangiaceae bacterium]